MSRRLELVRDALAGQAVPRTAPNPAPTHRARFTVEIRRPDGSIDHTVAEGGTSTDHAISAMERAGLGAKVRITQLPAHLGELA